MSYHVVDKVLAETDYQTQDFHVSLEGMVALRREESLTGIIRYFYQCDSFRQQFDTSEVVGFISPVLGPEVAPVICEKGSPL